ncbi:hypothetical protein TruAng_000238 [Truncatella angustata]|nr:hypothetical protein TruAng_000238 [Truncatella angustata]
MTTSDHSQWGFEAQAQSTLFLLPNETRREIYRQFFHHDVHVYLHQDHIRLSLCVQERLRNRELESYISQYANRSKADTAMWTRRIASSWGEHWKCEELAKGVHNSHGVAGNYVQSMSRACKRLYIDVASFVADFTTIHITDLAALSQICRGVNSRTLAPKFFGMSFSHVKRLGMTFKLDVDFCEGWGRVTANDDVDQTPGPAVSAVGEHWAAAQQRWREMSVNIAQLRQLQALHVSLDHNNKCPWAVVDERAILAPLAKAAENGDFALTIDLPMLEPHFQNPLRHYTADSPALHFSIIRRYRETLFVGVDNSGERSVVEKWQFPVLYHFYQDVDGFKDRGVECGGPSAEDMVRLRDQAEQEERNVARRGRDPWDYITELCEQ